MESTKCFDNTNNQNQRAQHKQDLFQQQQHQQYYSTTNDKGITYPIGDSKDVKYGQTHGHGEYEVSNDDNEITTNKYCNRNTYGNKPKDSSYLRNNSHIENEIGDYRDSQQYQHGRRTFDTDYANETTYDFFKEQHDNRYRAASQATKYKHQEIVKRLYNCERSVGAGVNHDLLPTQTQTQKQGPGQKQKPNNSYFDEQPKSHNELTTIFAQNHNINKKIIQSSLTPTENDALNRLMHDPCDPIRLKNACQRRTFQRPMYEQHNTRYENNEQHRGSPSYRTGKTMEAMKRYQPKKPDFYTSMTSDNHYNHNATNKSNNIYSPSGYDSHQQPILLNLPKIMKKTDPEVEVKYENNKFGHHSIDHNVDNYTFDGNTLCNNQTSESNIKDETSEDKISTAKFCGGVGGGGGGGGGTVSSKNKISARTNRSKRSNATHHSQKIAELYNVNRSKCNIMSVITDGLQKHIHHQPNTYESAAIQKSSQTQTNNGEITSNDKTTSSLLNYNADLTPNMLREYIEYHLSNIKEEVRRLERLENISTKD